MNPKAPRDAIGNELVVGNFVTILLQRPLVFKVAEVEQGGIQTPKGVTPAVVRITCDVTLRQIPGLPYTMMLKVVDPESQRILEDTSVSFPTPS